jgi:DNA polymerase-3 subunit gamma/tau
MSDSALQPYRVLARKYRPQRFGELIGQDAMVQTLANAIARDRLAHAFLLTGVRGVGKTSTARLIAKALNCVGPDGTGGPTINPCGECEPCRAIAEGRHIDVVEMDAASHTGVDDIREIIEAVRYASVSARYKVYIIDEVHMLSKNAFNALLKTLEEPPPHVKFLFATTEVQKVPVTVLSRCQRFDLKRIPADKLVDQFTAITAAEGVTAEPTALALIARAAEGSSRDGLSILDQAIAHADGDTVTTAQVREMLGLSDRGAVRQLFATLMAGDGGAALGHLRQQYDLGVEPQAILRALLELVHGITRAKVSGADDPALSVEERAALEDWASRLGHGALQRLWQMLLKGLDEVQSAPVPVDAAEMALLRVIHAANLPDPGDLVRRLMQTEDAPVAPAVTPAPAPADGDSPPLLEQMDAVPAPPADDARPAVPADFPALVALVESRGQIALWAWLHDHVRVVEYRPGVLKFQLEGRSDAKHISALSAFLRSTFGETWEVGQAEGEAEPTLHRQQEERERAERQAVLDQPIVKDVMAAFPAAQLIDYDRPNSKVA